MRTNNVLMICLLAVMGLAVICGAVLFANGNESDNNTTNNTTNVTNNTTLNLTNDTNNTTEKPTQTTSTKSQSSSQKSSSQKSSDDEYHYSAQYGTYIKEWEDDRGSHMQSKDGQWEAHYNEKTGAFSEKTPYDGWTSNT